MTSNEDLQELMEQVQEAIDKRQRSCLVCFYYVLCEHGTKIKCRQRVRVWEYAARLSPTHEIKCLHRARNCHTYEPEDYQSLKSLRASLFQE